jgi:hypothetical protein
VGEQGPEVVSLRAGSAVTPNHMLNNTGEQVLTTRIDGRDLLIVLDRANAHNNRR